MAVGGGVFLEVGAGDGATSVGPTACVCAIAVCIADGDGAHAARTARRHQPRTIPQRPIFLPSPSNGWEAPDVQRHVAADQLPSVGAHNKLSRKAPPG